MSLSAIEERRLFSAHAENSLYRKIYEAQGIGQSD